MKFLRGWFGEQKTTFKLWLSLDSKTYRRFHNIIIPSNNGTTQIDHLLISPFGIFIIETKNRRGWIFGLENQSNWTQTLYNKKFTFQNPLRQIYRHKKVVSEFLELDEAVIHTIVYFVGDCEFKTPMPANVLKSGLRRWVRSFNEETLNPDDIEYIVDRFNRLKLESKITKKDHIRSLENRHNSSTHCPKCGSKLVEREARKGFRIGSKFLGCESFPKCRFTKEI